MAGSNNKVQFEGAPGVMEQDINLNMAQKAPFNEEPKELQVELKYSAKILAKFINI